MEKHIKISGLYIATLKAIALISQNAHWQSKGSNSYGNHLLFERIYNSALENLDLAAEKLVGLFGDQVLDYEMQVQFLTSVMQKYKNFDGSFASMCLAIETDFLKLSQQAFNHFEENDKMTLGLNDAISLIANKREEAIYLLKQSLEK